MPPPYTPGSDIGAKSVAQQKLLSGAVILDFGSGAAVIGGGCTAFADEQGSTKIAAMTARDLAAAMPSTVHHGPPFIGSSSPKTRHTRSIKAVNDTSSQCKANDRDL